MGRMGRNSISAPNKLPRPGMRFSKPKSPLWKTGRVRRLEGIDISRQRVQEANRYARVELKADADFRVGDVNRIKLPRNKYDLILSVHSFHHFVELEHIMEEVSRALTQNGMFVLEEYVGPTQFQWTEEQMAFAKLLLGLLPERYRKLPWGAIKMVEGRPAVAEVVAASPFESIRSAEIVPLFKQCFKSVKERKLGGTIQHLLYNGIICNFSVKDREAERYIRGIFQIEDALIDSDMLPSDFMLLIGKNR